jgi:RNA ligase
LERSMNFPEIRDIDDVLKHIGGCEEFNVMDKGDYIAIDYAFAAENTFDHPAKRECRGIKFRRNGELMARPYHKFFNIGEKPETQPNLIDIGRPHVVLDKLDGSMIHPARIGGEIVFMTRAGVTSIAEDARAFASDAVLSACAAAIDMALTPIFEWCSLRNRVVVRYDQPRLVLTGLRRNGDGRYSTTAEMHDFARSFGIPDIVTAYGAVDALDAFIARAKALKDAEGFVIRFDDGHMLKMKADEYVMRHKAKDQINLEKNALAAVVDNRVDDLIALLSEDDAASLRRYSEAVQGVVKTLIEAVQRSIAAAHEAGADRKTFALDYVPKLALQLRPAAFIGYTGGDVAAAVAATISKACKSQGRVDDIRGLLGGLDWYNFYGAATE